jgi:hypothetical protein
MLLLLLLACHSLVCTQKKNRHPALRAGLTETQFRDFVCEDLDEKKRFVLFFFPLFGALEARTVRLLSIAGDFVSSVKTNCSRKTKFALH